MRNNILVTGSTGNVGRELMRLLKESHAQVIDTTILKEQDSSQVRFLDFGDLASIKKALADIDTVFLLRPPQLANVKKFFHPFLEEAKRSGVKHIVFLSLQGAENNSFTPHHKIESYIKKIGLPYTFLRPSFFMQNLTTTHLAEIKEQHEIFVPAGNGKTSFIDVRDIAAVAAKVILEGAPHYNKAYELTGPQALSYTEVAKLISAEIGSEVKYRSPSVVEFFFRKRKQGLNLGFVFVMIAIYTVCRLGMAAKVSDTVSSLLKRKAISLQEFIKDNRQLFVS